MICSDQEKANGGGGKRPTLVLGETVAVVVVERERSERENEREK